VIEGPLERSLFAHGGELGQEMSARQWAETPVGPPSGWPSGLRNAVRIVLTSRFSMWAAWGPELTTFYNDAYRGEGPVGVPQVECFRMSVRSAVG
jgi:hypothetical protein